MGNMNKGRYFFVIRDKSDVLGLFRAMVVVASFYHNQRDFIAASTIYMLNIMTDCHPTTIPGLSIGGSGTGAAGGQQ